MIELSTPVVVFYVFFVPLIAFWLGGFLMEYEMERRREP